VTPRYELGKRTEPSTRLEAAMRVNVSHQLSLAAATLLGGCNSTTGPGQVEEPADIQVLTVAPSFAAINSGRFIKLTAMVAASGPRAATPTDVTWFSADTNVATVLPGGLVEARKAGRVQIVATWHEARGSAVVIVLNQVSKKPLNPACLKRIPTAEKYLIPDGSKC
jgi:hypothetical protein